MVPAGGYSEELLLRAGYETNEKMLLDMKLEYYNMAKSVTKYGGFYVGRFESSIDGSTIASKRGVEAMTGWKESGNIWLGEYSR